MIKASQKVTLDDVFNKIAEGEIKGLNMIVKADVQGSVEAVKQSLERISNEEIQSRYHWSHRYGWSAFCLS